MRFRAFFIVVALAIGWWGAAFAQTPQAWAPQSGNVTLAVTSTSSNVALPAANASPAPPNARVCNTGANAAYVIFGGSTVAVTTTTGYLVAAGVCNLFQIPGSASYLAAITSSSTSSLVIEAGSGSPLSAVPGGAGGVGAPMQANGAKATSAALGNIVTNAAGLTASSVLVTSAGGVPSFATTLPSGLAATSMALTTPTLGVATGISYNKWTLTAPTTAATLIAGGDNLTYTMPAASKTIMASDFSNETAPAHTTKSVAAPNNTGSGVQIMMGLAGTITPTVTGTVRFAVVGTINNNTIADGCQMQIRTGTGTAPAANDPATGTARGSIQTLVASTAAGKVPFSTQWTVTGLTLSTALWIDLGFNAVTGGTCTATTVDIIADELP